MSNETIATLVGLGVFVALRVVDYLLPKGRHFTWVDRFTRPDDAPRRTDEREDEDEDSE